MQESIEMGRCFHFIFRGEWIDLEKYSLVTNDLYQRSGHWIIPGHYVQEIWRMAPSITFSLFFWS